MFLIMRTEKKIKDILKSIKINIRLKSDLYNQLDSMQFLKLLTELEKKFKVKIPDKKINISNFQSVERIKKIINEKKK